MGATTPTTFPRRRDFSFTPVSSTRAVPLSMALLKSNPSLHSALRQFETTQLKFEQAFVTPWLPTAQSSSPGGLAEAWKRRASLYSQDEEDDSEEDDSVWGDDEMSDSEDVEDDDYFGSEAWAMHEQHREQERQMWESRGRSRQRDSPDRRQRSASLSRSRSRSPSPLPVHPLEDRDPFFAATPPLLPSFKLNLPNARPRIAPITTTPELIPSFEPVENSHFSEDSSSSSPSDSDFSESALTLYSPTDDTAVDVDESWERAMRFSGWIRQSDLPASNDASDCFVPIALVQDPEADKWQYKGRKRNGAGAAKAAEPLRVAEGLRRLVDLVQA